MKKTVLTLALVLSYTISMAQQNNNDEDYRHIPHFYFNMLAGGQYTLGEAEFQHMLSPNAQIELGYHFNPLWGVRLDVNGWQSKGGWKDKLPKSWYSDNTTYKFYYINPSLMATLSLTNLFQRFRHKSDPSKIDYKAHRNFDVGLSAGIGCNVAFHNNDALNLMRDGWYLMYIWKGTKARLTGKVGIDARFIINDWVSLVGEVNANILNDHYNSKKASNPDMYFNALLGISMNLNPKHEKPGTEIQYERDINYRYDQIIRLDTINQAISVQDGGVRIREIFKNDTINQAGDRVFFVFADINSPEPKEPHVIGKIAKEMKEHPKMLLTVIGYADEGTGTDKINDPLSAARAAKVADLLVSQYGISRNRIVTSSVGARARFFPDNDRNRVAVCILSE